LKLDMNLEDMSADQIDQAEALLRRALARLRASDQNAKREKGATHEQGADMRKGPAGKRNNTGRRRSAI